MTGVQNRGSKTMPCPKCDGETRVKDTRRTPSGWLRRRKCQNCGNTFSTAEVVIPDLRQENNRDFFRQVQDELLFLHIEQAGYEEM